MKKIITILFFIFIVNPLFAETIKLKSGKQIEGKIIEQTNEYIKINFQNISFTYYLDEIESIDGKFILFQEGTSSPAHPKTPKDIFKEVSPAIVYILNKTVSGEEVLGSGFIIDKEGIIVTNLHVAKGAKELLVKLKDGKTYPATGIIYYDDLRDIFILKINASNLPTISLGDSNALDTGETVYCIGNPLGLAYTLSDGLLSAVRDSDNLKYLQFTAPISPGNSGGPLINPQGQAIGIVTFLMPGGQNLNFAISINEIKPFITKQPLMTFNEFTELISQFKAYFAQGEEYAWQDNYNQAIVYFQKALQLYPNDAEIHRRIGDVYLGLKQYREAIPYLQKAIQLNPALITFVYDSLFAAYLGTVGLFQDPPVVLDSTSGLERLTKDQWQEIVHYFQKAIIFFPNYDPGYEILGYAYSQLGQYDKAKNYLEKAIILLESYEDQYFHQKAEKIKKELNKLLK